MRLVRYCFLFFALCLSAAPSYAQWAVFDASNLAEAVKEFKQLQQVYTTANQTRDQIIQAYNLAHYMSQMPQNLSQRYNAQFALWTNLNAPNTYGNTGTWINALNTGIPQQSSAGYAAAVVQVNPYPPSGFGQLDASTQATIRNQYATSDLAEGTTTGAMTALGQIRSHSESLNQQISNLEADSYSNDPTQQSEMAVLGKVNAANLIQLHSQQDTNQLLAAGIQQQMVAQKQAIDTQNRSINQAIYFQQNFPTTMQKINNGVSQSIQSISFSTGGH
ncbi:MAG TPA: hypothetical protein VNZ03_06805 [Terriglobales bacterium]|nr:hypothetical protein [Terriglobales bacterium]